MSVKGCGAMAATSITTSRAAQSPGQNTFAFCSLVAAEEIRLLLRYLVGESWWHDIDPTSGLWAFEHRFVDASTKLFEHPSACVSSCEFTHKRLGLGGLGPSRVSFPARASQPFEQACKALVPASPLDGATRACYPIVFLITNPNAGRSLYGKHS